MFLDTITQNHDLQVRFRREPNSCAIWDNRSVAIRIGKADVKVFHAATPDYDDRFEGLGIRATGIGKVPYLDPSAELDVNEM